MLVSTWKSVRITALVKYRSAIGSSRRSWHPSNELIATSASVGPLQHLPPSRLQRRPSTSDPSSPPSPSLAHVSRCPSPASQPRSRYSGMPSRLSLFLRARVSFIGCARISAHHRPCLPSSPSCEDVTVQASLCLCWAPSGECFRRSWRSVERTADNNAASFRLVALPSFRLVALPSFDCLRTSMRRVSVWSRSSPRERLSLVLFSPRLLD